MGTETLTKLFCCECFRCKAFRRELARLERAFGPIEVLENPVAERRAS